ncbi:hypothetical protein RI367_002073 [Sorochytrium milnesiophthora]
MSQVSRVHRRIEGDLGQGAAAIGRTLGLVADTDKLDIVQCKDGITNKLFKVSNSKTTYLVRIYGNNTDRIIDRNAESNNMSWLQSHGLAAPLHARFDNGLVYGFIPGAVCTADDLSKSDVYPAIAEHLAIWHSLPLADDAAPTTFNTMAKWLRQVPASSPLDMAELSSELDFLSHNLPKSPLAFTHNDLLSGNIIIQTAAATGEKNARFIDYEYSSIGYVAFDIANHFVEYAGFACDWAKYPSPELQRDWITRYLQQLQRSDMKDVTVDALAELVKCYTLASHLYWILWALVQSAISDIDFDYAAYAVMRWKEYQRWKADVLHWTSR